MNLNNIFKKVTGVALAATLSFGAFAGNAFAAATGPINGGTPGSTEASTTKPTLTKTVTGGNYFGGGTFNFTITPVDIEANTYTGYTSRPASNFITLKNEGQNDGELKIDAGQTKGSLDLNINQETVNNLLPGVYRFEITENDTNIAGITKDPSTMTVDAFVTTTDGEDRKVEYFIVSENGQKADLAFENTFSQENLTIAKAITGNQSNKSDTFTFEITVTPAEGTTNNSIGYYVGETSDTATPTRVTPGENGSTVITLTNNVTDGTIINLTGLAAGDSIAIKETDSNNYGGYVVSASNTTVSNAELGADGVTATVNGNNDDITWTNSRTANTPTGLIENIAPFVLAIAAAGIVFFVYFKRDKEEELA